ncbi:MAG: GNAT family N-acetyltransferase [Nocardioidaceae bacterium]
MQEVTGSGQGHRDTLSQWRCRPGGPAARRSPVANGRADCDSRGVTGYVLRPASPDDSAALYVLHRAAMGRYLEALYGPWDKRVQTAFHAAWFDAARVSVIERDGSLIGVLDCTWHADGLEVNRIAIDPRHQGQGIGTEVLTDLLAQADQRHLPTRLQVFDINPARRLYERLGFVEVGCTGHKVHMARSPRASTSLRPAPKAEPKALAGAVTEPQTELDAGAMISVMSPRSVVLSGVALLLLAVGGLVVPVVIDAGWLLAVALAAVVAGLLTIGSVLAPQRSSFRAGTKLWQNDGQPGGGDGGGA